MKKLNTGKEGEMDEKLVDEMDDRLCTDFCHAYDFAENNCNCYIGITWGTAQSRCKRLKSFREFFFARILSAVRDGLPLPGEVGRHPIEGFPISLWEWLEQMDRYTDRMTTLIALSPTGIPVECKERPESAREGG